MTAAGLLDKTQRPTGVEIGCAYGSTLGCLEAMGLFWNKVKATNPKFAPPLPFTHGYANSPSSLLCIDFGLRGSAATFTGEKLAGLEALLFAFDHIASGSAHIMLVCASDSLTPAAHNHLFATEQLSAKGDWTDGLIPGEGGVALVLESEASARQRGAKILAEIEGINFFPLDPKSSVAPMRVATGTRETAVFSSLPNIHAFGGWIQHLHKPDMPAVAPKYFTGDMLAPSPLLSVALAAQTLSGSPIIAQNGTPGLPLLNKASVLEHALYAVATGFDSGGLLGVAMLAKV
ncbi:MAG: beta-ketoacyl synthase N-terminal-like domain-containing protein [Planctomycetota bacterium]